MKKILFTLLISLTFGSFVNSQSIVYVDSSASGTNNGSSWTNAYTNLQTALDNASIGDSIWVTAAHYFPTKAIGNSTDPRSKSFILPQSVKLFGGFDGTETNFNQRDTSRYYPLTILSGDIGTATRDDNAYHILIGIKTTGIIDKFKITRGQANHHGYDLLGTDTIPRNLGGGVFLDSSTLVLSSVYIAGNIASKGGGGVFNENGSPSFINFAFGSNQAVDTIFNDYGGGGSVFNINSSPNFNNGSFYAGYCENLQGGGAIRNEFSNGNYLNVTIYNCTDRFIGDGGAAMYNLNSNPTMTDILFDSNATVGEGGAMYNDQSVPILTRVIFNKNLSGIGGGAMENDAGSNVVINQGIFQGNVSNGNGGAIQNWKSSIVLNDVKFMNNQSGADGGAMCIYNTSSPSITNCTFTNNTAAGNGGALYVERNSNPIITNTLIARNHSGNKGGGIHVVAGAGACNPVATNVTIANNKADVSGGGIYDDGAGNSKVRNSIIAGNKALINDDADVPVALIATAVNNVIVDQDFYLNGVTAPTPFTGLVFTDSLLNDFTLIANSPAINVGDSGYFAASAIPNISAATLDLGSSDRIMGSNIDLGAYEYCTQNFTSNVFVTANPSTSVAFDSTITLIANSAIKGFRPAYLWSLNGVSLNRNPLDSSITLVAGTDFVNGDTVKVTLAPRDKCVSRSDTFIVLNVTNPPVGLVNPISTKTTLTVYPNPNNGTFTIKANLISEQQYNVRIIDLTGQEVYQTTIAGSGSEVTKQLNLGDQLSKGIYFISMGNASENQTVQKIVIR
jgi:predicted outer membrane repeat protein